MQVDIGPIDDPVAWIMTAAGHGRWVDPLVRFSAHGGYISLTMTLGDITMLGDAVGVFTRPEIRVEGYLPGHTLDAGPGYLRASGVAPDLIEDLCQYVGYRQ